MKLISGPEPGPKLKWVKKWTLIQLFLVCIIWGFTGRFLIPQGRRYGYGWLAKK